MDSEKYDVIPIYVTKNNEFYIGFNIGNIEAYTDINSLLKTSQRVILVNDDNKVKLIRYPIKLFPKGYMDYIDVAFPIVHGTNVEDGTLQGYLKMLNIPYVGCDVISSAVGMDKYVMKTVLKDNNIPVLDCRCFTGKQYDADNDAVADEIEEAIGYPVIVKPVKVSDSGMLGVIRVARGKSLVLSAFTACPAISFEPLVATITGSKTTFFAL